MNLGYRGEEKGEVVIDIQSLVNKEDGTIIIMLLNL